MRNIDLNRKDSVAVFRDPRKSSGSFGGKYIKIDNSENKTGVIG